MGLSAYPTAADVGIICMILLNAANLMSIFKNFFLSTIQMVGIKFHLSKLEEEEEEEEEQQQQQQQQIYSISSTSSSFESCNRGFPDSNSFKKMKYNSLRSTKSHKEECSICLTEFEEDSVIHQLSCGHFFHSHCLNTWLRYWYWYFTCPLCRTQIVLQEQQKCTISA